MQNSYEIPCVLLRTENQLSIVMPWETMGQPHVFLCETLQIFNEIPCVLLRTKGPLLWPCYEEEQSSTMSSWQNNTNLQ